MNQSVPSKSLWSRLIHGVADFVTAPASAKPLASLRIGVSLILIGQALAFAAHVLDLFGQQGVMQWPLGDLLVFPGLPRISWIVEVLTPLGISATTCVRGVFLLYVAGLSALLVGWHTRVAAAVAWFFHLTLVMSGRGSVYGVDDFANIALFYCIWMPVGRYASLDVLDGRANPAPSFGARLGLRVLQIQMCVVYFFSGIDKAMADGGQWWSGEAIWRALMLPEYRHFDMEWLANFPWLARLICWGTLAVETGYAFLIWPRWTKKPWAFATIGMHAGIAVMLGLVSFAALMSVLTFSAFVVSPETVNGEAVSQGNFGKS